MNDSKIIELFWQRDQNALSESSKKYGGLCMSVALNILHDATDAEECVNDTWLSAWNSMPPHRPNVLSAFLARLTRNISFNRYKLYHAQKRGEGNISSVLDELAECIPGGERPEDEFDRRQLISSINDFLSSLTAEKRTIFVRRYFYTDSVGSIAHKAGMSESAVSMALTRMRRDLMKYLNERGFDL